MLLGIKCSHAPAINSSQGLWPTLFVFQRVFWIFWSQASGLSSLCSFYWNPSRNSAFLMLLKGISAWVGGTDDKRKQRTWKQSNICWKQAKNSPPSWESNNQLPARFTTVGKTVTGWPVVSSPSGISKAERNIGLNSQKSSRNNRNRKETAKNGVLQVIFGCCC